MISAIEAKKRKARNLAARDYLNIYGEEQRDLNAQEKLMQILAGPVSKSGVTVTEKTALEYPPYWRALNIIAGLLSSFPLNVYQRQEDEDNDRVRIRGTVTSDMLSVKANPHMTPKVVKKTLQGHALGWGNGYAEVQRNESGRAILRRGSTRGRNPTNSVF